MWRKFVKYCSREKDNTSETKKLCETEDVLFRAPSLSNMRPLEKYLTKVCQILWEEFIQLLLFISFFKEAGNDEMKF